MQPALAAHVAGKKTMARRHFGVMEQILNVLYGMSGIAASALYVPQILKYHHAPDARRVISLASWTGWIAIAMVTILYALYVVKSYLFAAVASLNVAAQIVVLFYGIHARLAKRAARHDAQLTGKFDTAQKKQEALLAMRSGTVIHWLFHALYVFNCSRLRSLKSNGLQFQY